MKKVYKAICLLLAVVVLAVCSLIIYASIEPQARVDLAQIRAELMAVNPKAVRVDGVKLYTQPDGFSCGPTAMSVVASFLKDCDTPPKAIIDKYKLPGGMSYDRFIDILGQELPDYEVKYRYGMSDPELIRIIHRQLKSGVPVPVFFGAANPYNKPHYDIHTSVVIGLDIEKETVDVLNVYGYMERLSLAQFLDRMSFRGIRNYPIVQKIVIRTGVIKKNAVVLLVKK